MVEPILASASHIFAASFGVAAAVLAVGGLILVRLRRDRYHFDLMRTALEQGLSAIPSSVPFWLASLRQGVMILTLGLALLAVGGVGYSLSSNVQAPDWPTIERASSSLPASLPEASVKPGRDSPHGPPFREVRPPPNPAKERWDRAQRQESVSLIVLACGAILMPLGLVRIGFARVERRYSVDSGTTNPTNKNA
jgi:hypothetical protein